MRFKLTQAENPSHKAPVTCIGWSTTEEVYSTGDDNLLLSWSVSDAKSIKVHQFNKELYPTDMQFLPRTNGSLGKQGDVILITAADGKFHILNRNGRIERSIEAHKGAILVGQWSNDGTGLLTGGEDGFIKIWSRSGMLRSTVVSSDNSIYAASWSPDSQSIAYSNGKCITIKQLAPNTKPLKWKAHEGIILCLAWSTVSELLVSGGEDCRYRVWDNSGRQIFSSTLHDNHIVSLSWSPNGDLFSVGSYNTLRLCDYSGWSRSLDKPNSGSIYKMCWSADGTQLAAACANGHVIFAHVIERDVHYANFTASLTERKTVTVNDVQGETSEILDIPDRVIQISMRYSHLVLTTPLQCYIYNTSNWNTPVIFDLKEGSVILLKLAERHMMLIEKNNVNIYNYQGKLVASPRWPNMRPESLKSSHISLSSDTLIVRDSGDPKLVYIIDLNGNRSSGVENTVKVQHFMHISLISLDQWGPSTHRNMAALDKARDLYIVSVRSLNKIFSKLGRKIESFQWNSEENILAAIQDTLLIVWYCPQASFDSGLLKLCSFHYDSPELGRSPRINDFVANSVSVRRSDGSLVNVQISPFPSMLLKYIQDNKWTEGLNLCRTMNNKTLWACMAVLSTQNNSDTIDIAEESFANISHYDKVYYIQHTKRLSNKVHQKAALSLLAGKHQEAESLLLHNGMVFPAIYNNIKLHKWDRALEIAIKHKTHIDSVLFLRNYYLNNLGKSENNNRFTSIQESTKYDEDIVKEKVDNEITLWLLPHLNQYGGWPASGEIDIMESRGNVDYIDRFGKNIGTRLSSSTLHWGTSTETNRYSLTHYEQSSFEGFDKDWHLFQMEWTPNNITFKIDDDITGVLSAPKGGFWELGKFQKSGLVNPWKSGSRMAPFDQEFYIIVNLAVGGVSFFPDDATNAGGKPWSNQSPKASTDFWAGKQQWLPTWNMNTDKQTFLIDYIRVWAL